MSGCVADTFLDSAISSTGRVNGQSNDPSKVKTLVQWDDDSESTGLSLEDAGTAGSVSVACVFVVVWNLHMSVSE